MRWRTAAGVPRQRIVSVRALCRQSAEILASLDLDPVFTLSDLHRAVQSRRGRPLHLLPQQMPSRGPCGLWISGRHADYVFYDAATSPVHQLALVGHEFGHMLFDDAATSAQARELAALLMPDLDLQLVSRLMARSSYEQYRERRAEVFASVVVQRLRGWSDAPLPATADPGVLARLVAALGPPGRDD